MIVTRPRLDASAFDLADGIQFGSGLPTKPVMLPCLYYPSCKRNLERNHFRSLASGMFAKLTALTSL